MSEEKIELYRPSNGTEGMCFFDKWCSNCALDKPMSEGKDYDKCEPNEVCQIIADSMFYDVDDPKYPREWRLDADGCAMCTAFVPVGRPVPIRRCEKTMELPL